MLQTTLAKLLLAPLSLLYGMGVSLRNWFYRRNLLRGISFSLPVISVGNLSVGGAGKTPHIEYLIRKLHPYLNIATLSRGYRRKTKGFLRIESRMNAEIAGDEPLQYKRKFPDVEVTVAEERALAIPLVVGSRPDTQLILLDDAFQHRAVRPGLNILLTEYDRPFTRDYLLPSGRLREWRSAYTRADIIIVTKCPPDLSLQAAEALKEEIDPQAHQQIFFSYYDYAAPYYLLDRRYVLELTPDLDILLISAIANTDYLLAYLQQKSQRVRSLDYEDHHYFDKRDLSNLKMRFDSNPNRKKAIITTEKDATRLELHRTFIQTEKLPIFVLPLEVRFHFDEEATFDALIQNFLLNFRA